MSPSISDLFGTSPEGGTNDAEINVDTLMSDVDRILAARPPLEGGITPSSAMPPPAEPAGVGDASQPIPGPVGDVGGGPPVEPPVAGDTPPEHDPAPVVQPPAAIAPPPAPPLDPVRAMLEEALADPTKRDQVLRAIAGTPAPPAVPAPALPEDVDPASFEATLWRQQQETNQRLASIAEGQRVTQEQFVRQQATAAAQAAGQSFAARYSEKLTTDEVLAIAKHAGATGTAGALAALPQYQGNLQAAYEAALEHVLWSTEAYRDKVIGVAQTPTPPAASTPAAVTRKRQLHALSSAASPISAGAPTRPPLESRADGRLTPTSRQQVVKEAATAIARSRSEGTF